MTTIADYCKQNNPSCNTCFPDLAEPVRAVLRNSAFMHDINVGVAEIDSGNPGVPVSELKRKSLSIEDAHSCQYCKIHDGYSAQREQPGDTTVELSLVFKLRGHTASELLDDVLDYLWDFEDDSTLLQRERCKAYTMDIVLDVSCERCGKVGAHNCHPEYRHKDYE